VEPLSNRLLGYPDDARLLIVNADDFGMCHAVNEAILRAITKGIVTSTTIMMPCPWARHATRILREHPDLCFGVHLTLVSDFAIYPWRPLAGADRAPSLVDESGLFFSYDRIPELLARARLDEVELEYRAQIEAVLAADLAPTHLDRHCIADGGREDIFDLSVRLAREFGLALRVHDRMHAQHCRAGGLPVADHDVLDSYHLGAERKPAVFAWLLRNLPPGITEWAVHPSLGNEEAQALEPDTWNIRRADLDFLTSPEASEILDEEEIVLLDYRPLQAVWSRPSTAT
jgi:predicted glycoside hydrolase/deacetylase ChbG (UPF0249 family)